MVHRIVTMASHFKCSPSSNVQICEDPASVVQSIISTLLSGPSLFHDMHFASLNGDFKMKSVASPPPHGHSHTSFPHPNCPGSVLVASCGQPSLQSDVPSLSVS